MLLSFKGQTRPAQRLMRHWPQQQQDGLQSIGLAPHACMHTYACSNANAMTLAGVVCGCQSRPRMPLAVATSYENYGAQIRIDDFGRPYNGGMPSTIQCLKDGLAMLNYSLAVCCWRGLWCKEYDGTGQGGGGASCRGAMCSGWVGLMHISLTRTLSHSQRGRHGGPVSGICRESYFGSTMHVRMHA